jgi:dihydroceramidase
MSSSLPPSQPSGLSSGGYWGDSTSTIDWCEPNYQVTVYIAEFVNTVSSLVIVFFGLLGFYANYHKNHLLLRHMESRMFITYGLLALIGVGSFMFHGTLLFEFQLLDELPMIYIALSLAYCVTEDRREKKFRYLAQFFVFAAIAMTVVYIKVPSVYLFENVYGIIIVYGIARGGWLSFKSPRSDSRMNFNFPPNIALLCSITIVIQSKERTLLMNLYGCNCTNICLYALECLRSSC